MGRQVNFFLGTADQAPFEQALATAGRMTILASCGRSPVPETLSSTLIRRFGEDTLRVLLAREADATKARLAPIRGRNEFSVGASSANVIEFDRCFVAPAVIRVGRLYVETAGREPEFVAWADRVLKAARRSLTMFEKGWYAGDQALQLRAAGVRFEHF